MFRVLNPFANAPHHDDGAHGRTTITQRVVGLLCAPNARPAKQKIRWAQVLGPVTELFSHSSAISSGATQTADQACVGGCGQASHQPAVDARLSDYQHLVAISSPC